MQGCLRGRITIDERTVTQNIYDNETFFEAYSRLPRSVEGLDGAPEWAALCDLLPELDGLRVLDLGCGFGWFCRWAREHGAASVLGADVSERMLARARAETHDPAISYVNADLEHFEITPETFDVAYNIIGGGEEGDKRVVRTKEEADHSLPYMLAAAVLDGQLMPEQYSSERITRPDVQSLLRRVTVRPLQVFSSRFPDQMPCRLTVRLRDGRELRKEKRDYEGFHTRPMDWDTVVRKFERLSERHTTPELRREIVDALATLDSIPVTELTGLLAKARIRAG